MELVANAPEIGVGLDVLQPQLKLQSFMGIFTL